MIKFHDYNPDKPFKVEGEFHDVSDGKIILNYTPKQGTVIATVDGKKLTESATDTPKAGEFYIDYAAESDYKQATQTVLFNEADNGKRVQFDYEGVSTLIRAEHMNEIRDFMNRYDEDRATDLVNGSRPPRRNETVEKLAEPDITDTTEIEVVGIVGNMISVDTVEGIEEGKTYTITDGTNYEEFEVASINAESGVVTAKSLTGSYESGKIVCSTATMTLDGAIVAGDTQTIKWGKKEVWKGAKGVIESKAEVDAKGAVLDGLSMDESGEFVVADNVKKVYSLIPIRMAAPVDTFASPITLVHDDSDLGAFVGFAEYPQYPPVRVYDSGRIEPFIPLCTPLVKTFNHNGATLFAVYIPPLWGKDLNVQLYGENRKTVAISTKPKDGYSLLAPFKLFPKGYWLFDGTNSSIQEVLGVKSRVSYASHVHTAALYMFYCGGPKRRYYRCPAYRSGQTIYRAKDAPITSSLQSFKGDGSHAVAAVPGAYFDIGTGMFVPCSQISGQVVATTAGGASLRVYNDGAYFEWEYSTEMTAASIGAKLVSEEDVKWL